MLNRHLYIDIFFNKLSVLIIEWIFITFIQFQAYIQYYNLYKIQAIFKFWKRFTEMNHSNSTRYYKIEGKNYAFQK